MGDVSGRFHIFLSHVWGTGQDQMRIIKQRLKEMMPDIAVFLDVDDLEEIGDLEGYIDRTVTVLVYCSDGYFRSKNCLREVVATVKKRKPVVLVWEPDPNKGGAPVEALKDELRAQADNFVKWSFDATVQECEDYIFRESQLDGRPTVPWVRIYDFQLKSLSMIAQTVLTDTPAYIPLKASRPLAAVVSTASCTSSRCAADGEGARGCVPSPSWSSSTPHSGRPNASDPAPNPTSNPTSNPGDGGRGHSGRRRKV